MTFTSLASTFAQIESTSSRLAITELLAQLFDKLPASEITEAVYLLQGRVSPLYQRVDFGVAEKMVIKSAIKALNIDPAYFKRVFQQKGDIGEAIQELKKEVQTFDEEEMSVENVYSELQQLAQAAGPGSQDEKISRLATLIRKLDPLSAKYVVRIPMGAMRLGFSDMTILDALSWMMKGDKTLRPLIEHAYHVRPDLGFIAERIKNGGIKGIEDVQPSLFTPIIMMRAERMSSGKEIVDKIGECAVEPKYDGFRLQIHYQKEDGHPQVKLYSRSLDDVSYMYPDIIDGIVKEVSADSIIMEGEAIGYDINAHSFLPFQETVQRKRKHNIEEKAKEIPLKLFAFELLYANGKNYLNEPYRERRRVLEQCVKIQNNHEIDTILLSPENLVSSSKDLELLFEDSITKGLEGIMAKKLTGTYQPGARGSNWIKFKRSYSTKIEDTIDCLLMGYDYGKGKRAGFGIGAFLVGIYDDVEDKYLTLAKIGTGLTDEEWRELKKRADVLKTDVKPALYEVDKMMAVDVWVKPQIIVEVKADEITRSPVHTAGRILKPSKSGSSFEVDVPGYALRFPRLEKFREDKRAEEATTLQEIKDIMKSVS